MVKAFRIVGVNSVPMSGLTTVLAPWIGRMLDRDEILKAADAVTQYLRETGLLIAQASVPAQEVRDGVVEMRVIEGMLGAVRLEVSEGSRLRRTSAERFVSALESGDTMRRDNVEQSLLLLNDLPGIRLNASVSPGARAGSADLLAIVENQGNPLSANLIFDNAGLKQAGEYRVDADLRLRSPLGLGDLLGVRLLSTTTGGQTLGSLTYGMPLNGLGTRVGLRVTEQHYRLGREFAVLEAHGRQSAISVLASHPLLRRSDRNVFLSFSHTRLDFSDRWDAIGFINDTRQQITGIALTADFRDAWMGGGLSVLQAQLLAGRVSLNTPLQAALDAAPGGLNVNGAFTVLRWRMQRAQAIDARSSLLVSVNGQFASKNLDAGTELAAGGPEAVRAYPVGEQYADQGHVARIDYRRDLALFESAPTTFSIFVDHARLRINRDPISGAGNNLRSLAGAGFGIRQALGAGISLQTTFAWRITDRSVTDADRSPRVWISLVASL